MHDTEQLLSTQVRSVSCDATGQWLLTGSDDGTVRLWEAVTGHCRRTWDLGAKVHCVAWCPDQALRLVSCVAENKAMLLESGIGGPDVAEAARLALQAPPEDTEALEGSTKVVTRWVAREGGGLEVVHQHPLRNIAWHGGCDVFYSLDIAKVVACLDLVVVHWAASGHTF